MYYFLSDAIMQITASRFRFPSLTALFDVKQFFFQIPMLDGTPTDGHTAAGPAARAEPR